MPVVLPFIPFMVELAAMEVVPVFFFEAMVIVLVISVVTVVSMPSRVRIIGIARIIAFVDADADMGLSAGGLHGQ
jgi:hypothetical protein